MKTNIILIGMPGCGKSTCGVLLAKVLCKQFVDTDLLLQEQEGLPLQALLERGAAAFAAAEARAVLSVRAENAVIATGGSVVYSEKAMRHLQANGTIVYLHISLPEMKRRIGNFKRRGILLRLGETLEEMYAEREPLYRRWADVTVETDALSIEETVEQLGQKLT